MLYYYFDFKVFVSSFGKPLGILQLIAVKFLCCFIQLHVLYGFINRRGLYPPRLIRFTWRGSWQWNQTRVILKTIIQSFKCHHKSGDWWGKMMEQLLYPALGALFWVVFHIFFLFERSLFQEVNILVDVNYHALVWTCGYLPEYETQYWHSYQFFKNTKWSGVSQTNYYDIWNANI